MFIKYRRGVKSEYRKGKMHRHTMRTVTVDVREIHTLGRRFVKSQEYSEVKIWKSVGLKCLSHSINYPSAMTYPVTKMLF